MIHGGFKLKGKTYRKIKNFFKREDKDIFYDSIEPIDNDNFYDVTDNNEEHIKTCVICWQPLGGHESIDDNTGKIRTLTELSCKFGHIVHTDDITDKLLRCPVDDEILDPDKFTLLDHSTVVYSTETGGRRLRRRKRRTERTRRKRRLSIRTKRIRRTKLSRRTKRKNL